MKILAALSFFSLLVGGCNPTASEERNPISSSTLQTPDELIHGETLLNTYCVRCHGLRAVGTEKGPPLVHKIYESHHHADMSFHRAVQMGVRAHHWPFGNMPSIQGLETKEVNAIVAYVRWLQQQAGIF